MISKHLNTLESHHAYLVEGDKEEVLADIHILMQKAGIKTVGNPDFSIVSLDSLKIDDAKEIKNLSFEKSFNSKKVFIICTNSILIEAQNTLLKIFEEPRSDLLFFVIMPNINNLLPTLSSRFYIIKNKNSPETDDAKKFISNGYRERIEFVKSFTLTEDENIGSSSNRAKALSFLNSLESVIYTKTREDTGKIKDFKKSLDQIFKAKEFIVQPGSSLKSLLESVCLILPKP